MRYITFGPETNQYPVALLTRYLREKELSQYVKGFEQDVVCYQITTNQKAKKVELDEYYKELLPILASIRVDYLVVTEGLHFKHLTKTAKVDINIGYVLPCTVKGYEYMHVLYVPSPQQMLYEPTLMHKVNQGVNALKEHRAGSYTPPGEGIIQFAEYPSELKDIKQWLDKLLTVDLTVDLETFSLKHYNAGIGTICLCWSKTEGIAFAVDKDNPTEKAKAIRGMLKEFFLARHARTIYHNGSFDIYVLIYQLFMEGLLDTKGLLQGLDTLLRSWDDTQLITYLATNSCAGNRLSLKAQAQEYAGNYMVDVEDIREVPLPDLLKYNLIDGLATWFVLNKHWNTMVADKQLSVYQDLIKPVIADIIQMQLTGLPLDMEAVLAGEAEMLKDKQAAIGAIQSTSYYSIANQTIKERWAIKRNQELKVKRVTAADCKEEFNINSHQQLQLLLYEVMALPVLEYTDTKQPATGKDEIFNLRKHTTDPEKLKVLEALVNYAMVEKLLTSFIPAFKAAPMAEDGHHYLYGFFNVGGTLSGRLSSNGPNLQNLPANAVDPMTGKPSKYTKLIKQMFKAPKGWLFVGLDFASLEDRISALTTKDPNKLKVYTDGYDGHSLRAFFYFREQMPDILDTVDSINSIQDKYKPLRQDSKAPTFALTYQGTWRTLMVNCGFSEEKAKMIEERYHEMYVVSDQWVQARLAEAQRTGYVTIAFGLRLRTPMLKQCVLGTKSTPYEAAAEGRTAGNALGQSYGLLNSRAVMAFMQKVRASKHRYDIKPCAQIHDASYYLIRDDIDLIHWMNIELVKEVKWQELPEIEHDEVKLGGELSVFHPNWAKEMTIPNNASIEEILTLAEKHINE